jgi:hypothetical protein
MTFDARSEALFYYFRLENRIPENHLLAAIDNLPIQLKEGLRSALEKDKEITVAINVPKKGRVTSFESFERAQP